MHVDVDMVDSLITCAIWEIHCHSMAKFAIKAQQSSVGSLVWPDSFWCRRCTVHICCTIIIYTYRTTFTPLDAVAFILFRQQAGGGGGGGVYWRAAFIHTIISR